MHVRKKEFGILLWKTGWEAAKNGVSKPFLSCFLLVKNQGKRLLKIFLKKFLKSVDKTGNMRYHIHRCSEQELNKIKEYVCVAQLDRALGYGPRCREFESSRARI